MTTDSTEQADRNVSVPTNIGDPNQGRNRGHKYGAKMEPSGVTLADAMNPSSLCSDPAITLQLRLQRKGRGTRV